MEDPCFWEWFIKGADGFITLNLHKEANVANGTPIKQHSIFPSSEEQKDFIASASRSRQYGNIITLAAPPTGLAVELTNEQMSDI